MNANSFKFVPQVEGLEEKNAPAPLTIKLPEQAAGTPAVTADLPDQACENGINAHAKAASQGVVACG